MKDNFSNQATLYAKFRPHYPPEMYELIFRNINEFECAWDCATGNGQVALQLAHYFKKVEATDISEQQLQNAFPAQNIHYQVASAEKTPFESDTFDLITVGQAIHWFDHPAFFEEAKRVAKPNGILAIWGYNFLKIDKKLNEVLDYFYNTIIYNYWDNECRHVENELVEIDFPFENIISKKYIYQIRWTFEQLIGYLNTWSAVQHYIQKNGHHPIDLVEKDLKRAWIGLEKTVSFPIFFKMMKIK